MKFRNRHGFTLAEVLITLGIIGVVAALTIPTVIQNAQERATVTAVKKAYSALSQAYISAVDDNGTPENWDLRGSSDSQGAQNMVNIFAPYLKLVKNCGVLSGCWPNVAYKYLKGSDFDNFDSDTTYAKAQASDGSLFSFIIRDQNCSQVRGGTLALSSVCGVIGVDINGFKAPNQQGVDAFNFLITKYGIIPHGSQQDTAYSFSSDCKIKSSATGWPCAAWILQNDNMDYLHCSNLSWSGPTKCQ